MGVTFGNRVNNQGLGVELCIITRVRCPLVPAGG